MRYVLGIAILSAVAAGIALIGRHYAAKRRKIRLRGQTERGRIDIPLAPKE